MQTTSNEYNSNVKESRQEFISISYFKYFKAVLEKISTESTYWNKIKIVLSHHKILFCTERQNQIKMILQLALQ